MPMEAHGSWWRCAGLLALCLWGTAGWAGQAGPDGGGSKKWRVPLKVKATDQDKDPLTYRWVQIAGPRVRIARPTSPNTYFVPTEPGQYVFEIRVSDGKVEVSKRLTIPVTLPNRPPVALAGADQKAILGQRVLIDGKNSKDLDGKIAAYQWRQVSGPSLKLTAKQLGDRQFFFDPKEPGRYVFELKVKDDRGAWSPPGRSVVDVAAINKRPVIEFPEGVGKARELPLPPPEEPPPPPKLGAPPVPKVATGKVLQSGDVIVLDGSKTTDPLGEEMEYFWKQVGNGKAPILRNLKPDLRYAKGKRKDPFASPVWRVTPTVPGIYEFTLEVTAGPPGKQRRASSKAVIYEVLGRNKPPVAHIFLRTPKVEKGQVVTLDGARSKDEDPGDKLEFTWGWSGEGLRPRKWIVTGGPRVQFTAEEEGTYGIQLVVSDGKAKSRPAKVKVIVLPVNRPPTVSVPKTISAMLGEKVRVEAIVSDPDNDRTEVAWKVIEPPDLKLPKKALAQNPLLFTPRKKRVYVLEVVARDQRGPSRPARVRIAVSGNPDNPPTAVITGPRAATVGGKVVLSAQSSKDPEGQALTYLWKPLAKAGAPAVPGAPPGLTEKAWSFTPEQPGEYRIQLVVSDGAHESKPAVWILKVGIENHPPVAKIKEPPVVFAGEALWLSGAESRDADAGDRGKLTYRWRVLKGAGLVEVDGRDRAKLKVKALKPGAVRFELAVNDGQADSAPASVTLKIKRRNAPPVARPSGPNEGRLGERIVLSAARSRDPDGEKITAYHWSQLKDGGPPLGLSERERSRKELRFSAKKPGSYVFQLVVVDREGVKSKPATWTVNVSAPKAPPIAQLHIKSRGPFLAGRPVELSAKGSADPAGHRLSYKWRLAAGNPEQLKLPREAGGTLLVVPKAAGSYTIELRVNNGQLDSPPVAASFKVQAENQPPVAVIAPIVPCEPGGRVTLNGKNSRDPEGRKLEYRWRATAWPKGAKPGLGWRAYKWPELHVALKKAGEYVFELKVFDGKLWSAPARAKVQTRPPNVPPVAVALAGLTPADLKSGVDPARKKHVRKARTLVTEERREVVLDGSGSSDPDHGPQPLRYAWRQLSGPRPARRRAEGPRLRFVPTRPGDAVWELKVNDGKADSQPARVTVRVLRTGTLPVAATGKRVIHAPVAKRGVKDMSSVIILNGTPSTSPTGKTLEYIWRQIGGEDLRLSPVALKKKRVGLRIFHPGKYRYALTVFDGEYFSEPAVVDVIVSDPSMTKPPTGKTPPGAGPRGNSGGVLLPPPKNSAVPHPVKSGPKQTSKKPPPRSAPQPAPAPREGEGALLPPPKNPPVSARTPPPPMAPVEPAASPKPRKKPDVSWITKLSGQPWSKPKYRSGDPLFQDRKKKLAALAIRPGPDAEKELIRSLDDRDKDLRRIAAYALAQRGLGSVPALIRALERGSKAARVEAHRALQQLSGKKLPAEAKPWKRWWTEQYGLPLE